MFVTCESMSSSWAYCVILKEMRTTGSPKSIHSSSPLKIELSPGLLSVDSAPSLDRCWSSHFIVILLLVCFVISTSGKKSAFTVSSLKPTCSTIKGTDRCSEWDEGVKRTETGMWGGVVVWVAVGLWLKPSLHCERAPIGQGARPETCLSSFTKHGHITETQWRFPLATAAHIQCGHDSGPVWISSPACGVHTETHLHVTKTPELSSLFLSQTREGVCAVHISKNMPVFTFCQLCLQDI